MSENNGFWKHNSVLLVAGGLLGAVILGVGVLYRIESEFLFYEVVFILLFTLAAAIINHARLSRRTPEPAQQEIPEKDENWDKQREKEDFFALWAHQIKTPIAALQLLLQNEQTDARECRQELFKIESYVEMALNYLRFEEMSGDLVLGACDLESIVKQVVKKYSTIFIHRHLSVQLHDLEGTILTDEKWFGFVLEQVLSNALKYTKEGGVTIFARQRGDSKEIVIRDTGMGIRKDDLPRVFEKGYTGYNGRIDKKASGLGLYLCKGVCDKLGHKITITSQEGKGTDVIITVSPETVKASDLTKM